MDNKLQTIFLTKKELRNAIEENLFWKEDFATSPFSKNKAIWILSNDRIEEDDYCTMLALNGEELIACVNLVPDLFHLKDGIKEKLYWMTLWWVKETYKKTVIGTYLYNEAIRKVDNKIVGKAYAESANEFYKKQPFKNILSRKRFTIFFCADSKNIINKLPSLKRLKPFLFIAERLSFMVIKFLNSSKIKGLTKDLVFEYISQLDNDTWQFVESFCKNDLIYKTKEYINWQIDSNQYIKTPISKKSSTNSPYNGMAENIAITTLKVKKGEEVIGVISFLIINKEANIKYFIASEKHEKRVIAVLIEHLLKLGVNFLFTDSSVVAENISKNFKTFYTFSINKNAIAHNDIASSFGSHQLRERDGHFM